MARLLVVLVALACAPSPAHASCAEQPWSAFSQASRLPPDPTVYLFVATGIANGTITGTTDIVATLVATSPGVHVYRIRVLARSGFVTLTYQAPSTVVAPHDQTYAIGDAPPGYAIPISVMHRKLDDSCASNVIAIHVEGTAVAFRFDWFGGGTTIVPANAVSLGHHGLLFNVDPHALARARRFDFVALFADGSERRLGTSFAQLGDTTVRLPIELAPIHVPSPDEAEPPFEPQPMDLDEERDWSALAHVVLLCALVLLRRQLSP